AGAERRPRPVSGGNGLRRLDDRAALSFGGFAGPDAQNCQPNVAGGAFADGRCFDRLGSSAGRVREAALAGFGQMADDNPKPGPIYAVGRTSRPKPAGPSAFHRTEQRKRVQGFGSAYVDPAVALRSPGPTKLTDDELQEVFDWLYPEQPLPTPNTI